MQGLTVERIITHPKLLELFTQFVVNEFGSHFIYALMDIEDYRRQKRFFLGGGVKVGKSIYSFLCGEEKHFLFLKDHMLFKSMEGSEILFTVEKRSVW